MNIEPLESRIAPASVFVSATTATFDDVDGDHVTVKFSKPILTGGAGGNVASVVQVSAGGQLTLIELVGLGPAAQGTGISVTAKLAGNGDGFANVGFIDAPGFDLGAVVIHGDLGSIDAGDNTKPAPAVASLTVGSLGEFGMTTGATTLQSSFHGALGALHIAGNLRGVYVVALDGGNIGPVKIGGSIFGGAAAYFGGIYASGNLGAVLVTGSIIGGDADHAGAIGAGHKIGAVTIGGSLVGGTANHAGSIYSGFIAADDIGALKIGGSVQGGSGKDSGFVDCTGKLASVTIGGSIIGGSDEFAGAVFSKLDMGAAKIGGSIEGGTGILAGSLASNMNLASVSVGGSLVGGTMSSTGEIFSLLKMGPVKIAGSVRGGGGNLSGAISGGQLTSVSIGGSVIGGASSYSGEITSSSGAIGSVKIGGDLVGGSVSGNASLARSGAIFSQARIGSVFIGGSVFAGKDDSTGTLHESGSISAQLDIGSVTVAGDLIGKLGSMGLTFATIAAVGEQTPTATRNLAIGKITIGGRVDFADILAGYDTALAAEPEPTNGDAQIGAVKVGGDWRASNLVAGAMNTASGNIFFGDANDAPIAGVSATILSKIASITIGGQVFGTSTAPLGSHGFVAEQIGAFKVGGTSILLLPTAHNDNRPLAIATTNDVTIHEV